MGGGGKGGGAVEELVRARISFLTGQWCRQFFRAIRAFLSWPFVLHDYFLTIKALQEFFFSNLPLPPPPSPQKSNDSTLSHTGERK